MKVIFHDRKSIHVSKTNRYFGINVILNNFQ